MVDERGVGATAGKKKRRRRKAQTSQDPPSEMSVSTSTIPPTKTDPPVVDLDQPSSDEAEVDDLLQMAAVANFEFKPSSDETDNITMGNVGTIFQADPSPVAESNAIPLPDIRDARRRKQEEEKAAAEEQKLLEENQNKPKIKRSDSAAFKKVS
jgi:hypothetical protein